MQELGGYWNTVMADLGKKSNQNFFLIDLFPQP
jgi:hypothetical protein